MKKYDKDNIKNAIDNSYDIKDLLNNMGIKKENCQTHVMRKIKEYGFNIDHLKYKRGRKVKSYSNEDLFKINNINRSIIRKKIIKDNLIEYKCHNCGCNDEWMGKKMPLILDHINGINNDNRLENLRFLCSNCDSIQDTYKGKNKEKVIKEENKKILENNILKQEKINKILKANIDFSKKNWGVKVAEILNCSPQYALKFVKINNI